jgi:hypothetical protein
MSTDESTEVELFTTGYEIFIGALSVLSLVNIVLLAVLRDQALQTVVYTVDIVLSLAFLVDFTVRLLRSPARLHYFFRDFGWADLLASLPFPGEGAEDLPPHPGRASVAPLRSARYRQASPEGQGGKCPVDPAAHRRAGLGVRQPGDVAPGEERARSEHHDGL